MFDSAKNDAEHIMACILRVCTKDPATNKWYFWNTETGVSQWPRPYSGVAPKGVARQVALKWTLVLS